jgi:hypothetical protein
VIEHLYGKKFIEKYTSSGRSHHLKGLADMVIIYGAEPHCIQRVEGSNRVLYTRSAYFRELLKRSTHFLRPDRIFGAMVIKEHFALEPEDDKPKMTREILFDGQMEKVISQVHMYMMYYATPHTLKYVLTCVVKN